VDGVIVIDKPSGMSSHDVVQRVRRLTGIKRVGHLGTLDPLGTGVLPVVVGQATRLSQFFLKHDRGYEATIRCGFATSTYDRDGEPTTDAVSVVLDRGELVEALASFSGEILQTPPQVSAKKVGGVPAYKLARKKQTVALAPVLVQFYEMELLDVGEDSFRIRILCSAGTYVRSLAHDLGGKLGCGAYVDELRRTTMGEFDLSQAFTLPRLQELADQGRLEEALVPSSDLLPEMPNQYVDDVSAAGIAQGRDFRVTSFPTEHPAKRVKAINSAGRLLAIGELRLPGLYHPAVVFP